MSRHHSRGRSVRLAWTLLAAAAAGGAHVAAGAAAPPPDAAAQAQAHFRQAVADEESLSFATALVHYRAAAELAPAAPSGRAARKRIVWIEDRSEGDFAPLAALQRARRDREALHDAAAVDRFAAAADSFPAGRVRVEARLLLAETWLGHPDWRGARERAFGELRQAIADPHCGARDARYAQRRLVEALLADGRLDDAAAEIAARAVDPDSADKVQRALERRRRRRHAAWAVILVVACALGVVVVRRGGITGRT